MNIKGVRCDTVLLITLLSALPFVAHGQMFERVSVNSAGEQANAASEQPFLSGDGRFVVFASTATNLVPGDTNGRKDIFLRDRQAGTTERISVGVGGEEANGDNQEAQVSADGRYVVFASKANNLAPDDLYSRADIFVRDRVSGSTECISRDVHGVSNPTGSPNYFGFSISADGRMVAFGNYTLHKPGPWWLPVYHLTVFDRLTQRVTMRLAEGFKYEWANLSRDGTRVATTFESWTDTPRGVTVYDTRTGGRTGYYHPSPHTSGQVSLTPTLSADGSRVGFASTESNLPRLAMNDTMLDIAINDGRGNAGVKDTFISPDGNFICFSSAATDLVPADDNHRSDIFLYSLERQTTSRLVKGNGDSSNPVVSDDGRMLAFVSAASDLVPDDTNGVNDIFVRSLTPSQFLAPRILWHNLQSGEVTFWQTEWLRQSFWGTLATNIPAAWRLGATLDLDGDGRLDFVWQNTQTGEVAYWLMNDQGRQSYGTIARNVPTEWKLEAATDLTFDGNPELIWRSTRTGDVTYWILEGTGWIRSGLIYKGIPTEWRIEGAADFNGDGFAELLWRNTISGEVLIWVMEGDDVKRSEIIALGIPREWHIIGTPDLDQDGDPDLLWHSTKTGEVAYWLMVGTRQGSTGYLARNIPLDWVPGGIY